VGLFGSDMALAPAGQPANFSTAAGISYRRLEHTFLSPPQHVLTEQDSLLFGRLQPDGKIVPLN
jgi:hypothetical protein